MNSIKRNGILWIITFIMLSFSVASQEQAGAIPLEVLLENTINTNLEEQAEPIPNYRNQVFIEQIGLRNASNTKVNSERSKIGVYQSGNDNFINIDILGENVNTYFVQNGNENNSFSFVHDPNAEASLNLTQTGNSGHFESYGSNSISNKLKFETKGDYKSIIVRNFK